MIRKATPADASRLAEILIFAKRTSYRPIFQCDQVSFNEMSVLELALRYRDDPEMLQDVYVYDDGIVRGMMSWKRSPNVWQLQELYVDTFFQKQGYGEKLLKNFLENAGNNGAERVFLWALEKNLRARDFYEKNGFRFLGRKKLEEGTTEWLYKYEKNL